MLPRCVGDTSDYSGAAVLQLPIVCLGMGDDARH